MTKTLTGTLENGNTVEVYWDDQVGVEAGWVSRVKGQDEDGYPVQIGADELEDGNEDEGAYVLATVAARLNS